MEVPRLLGSDVRRRGVKDLDQFLAAALEAAATFHPDLALFDGLLPDGKGAVVAHSLRQAVDVPIIFVTGADSAEEIHSGFRMGPTTTS